MVDAASSSRRLLLLCIVTTVVPAVCLGWLAWQVVQDDRERQQTPVTVRRDRAADLAARSLEKLLSQTEEELGRIGPFGQSDALGPLVDGLTFVVLTRNGLGPGSDGIGYTGAKPFYLPNRYELGGFIDRGSGQERFQFDDLRRAEIQEERGDLRAALDILQPLLSARSPRVRAHALARAGMLHRKTGDPAKALEAFSALKGLGHARVDLLPAALAAALNRAAIFEETGRPDDLQREAAEIHFGLINARWSLTRSVFQQSYAQARAWLAKEPPPLDAEKVAVAEILDRLWQEGREKWWEAGIERTRQILWVNNVPVLVASRYSFGRVRVAFITPRYLERVWRSGLRATTQGDDIEFVLTDGDDRPVLGVLSGPVSLRTVRSGTVLPQPWKVHAITTNNPPILSTSIQTRALLSGIAVMGLLVVAGAYVISRAMVRELRAAQMQSEFVAAVSHEFRTPLTTIRQLAEMLVNRRVSSDERRLLFYDTLLRESERLQRLVEGLLNFGAMQAGELRYRFETIDLEPFVRDVVVDFERSIPDRGYRIDISSGDGRTPVRADRELLARVFWNLLDNAVKYSPDNRTIHVELTSAGHRVSVDVRDRGVGIAAAEQQAIFKKFVRGAAARSTSVQGMGVGLAMARQIVEAHRGEISVSSQARSGSVFTVLLPVANP